MDENMDIYIKKIGNLINPLITYTAYLIPFEKLNDFFKFNSELLNSFIKIYQRQYDHTDEYIKTNINNTNIISVYKNNFSTSINVMLLIIVIKNPNNGMKLTEIGSISVIEETYEKNFKIVNVFTLKSYRRNGLCIIMISILIDNQFSNDYKLKDKQIKNITLDVYTDNNNAIKCYKKIGFEIINFENPLIQSSTNKHYYTMVLNYKLYFMYLIKSKILELSTQSIKNQILKNQINILITKI
jgi:ribosomal protein S18 acetylase RimI-like enzyme